MDGGMYVLAYQCFRAALDLDPTYQPARTAMETLQKRGGFDPAAVAGVQPGPKSRTHHPRPQP